nr:tol-pal system protein YbgF [Hymenobacter piscis]
MQAPAQHAPAIDTTRQVHLANVDVSPAAADTKGWLLLDEGIKLELEGAMHNLYNFHYDRAEKQFRSLRRRYPQHPMPYFLMGLTQWWKIMPSNVTNRQFDKVFYAYMDTAIAKGERLYEADDTNFEASFLLSAAYGFSARLHAERHDLRKATVYSKRALEYVQRSQQANGLSPEFLFGTALFNYYAVSVADDYPFLRPILLFFPKGNRTLGLQQLRSTSENGFYTGAEASFFLMKILASPKENDEAGALRIARRLVTTYPDNAYFQRYYALLCFNQGEFRECERVSLNILDKLNQGQAGYESFSGRYATYYLGWVQQTKYKNLSKARDYYQRCIVFSELTEMTKGGYYLYANYNLGRIAEAQQDLRAAHHYYQTVLKQADRSSSMYSTAKAFLRQHRATRLTDAAPASYSAR